MIKLFTPFELFVGSVNLIENLPDSKLETCFEIIFQLTYVSYLIEVSTEKMSLKIKAKLFEDKQNFLFFFIGDKQNIKFGGI